MVSSSEEKKIVAHVKTCEYFITQNDGIQWCITNMLTFLFLATGYNWAFCWFPFLAVGAILFFPVLLTKLPN